MFYFFLVVSDKKNYNKNTASSRRTKTHEEVACAQRRVLAPPYREGMG